MSLDLGINVIEVDGNVAPSVQAAPTSNAGFVIRSERGVPGTVRRITSWRKFERSFGGYLKDAYGAYCIKGYFDNGGTVAFVTRVVSDDNGAQAASWAPEDESGLTVRAGRRGGEDPGAWGDALSVRVTRDDGGEGDGEGDDGEVVFTIEVMQGDDVVEVWGGLSVDGDPDPPARNVVEVINDETSGSEYVVVELDDGASAPRNTVDADGDPAFAALEGGADPEPDDDDYIAAFDRFETKAIQLLCCPESTTQDVVVAGIDHCEIRGDAMYVGHSIKGEDASQARDYGQLFQATKRYGALYFPWLKVSDPIGTRKLIPPTGHVLGVYARTARQRGVWKAPAGSSALVRGALDVEHHITDATHTDLVKNGSVNAVRFMEGEGIVVDSSRTLSTSPLWLYVNIRLLFNFVKSSLEDGLRWVVQEPNNEELWNKVKYNTVTPFLMGLWSRGAFGPGSPDEVFTVKCDDDTNSPEDIQQGRFNIEVYFYPSRPAETILLTVGQQEGGASSSES